MNYKTVGVILAIASILLVAELIYVGYWINAAFVAAVAIVGIPGAMFAQASGRGFDS